MNLGAMPAWLSGARPARDRTPAEAAADIAEAVGVLRASDNEGAIRVADGLAAWLATGGRLDSHLGVRVSRGKASELPYKRARLEERAEALRSLAAEAAPGRTAQEQARTISAMVLKRDPRTVAIHQSSGLDVPTSAAHIARILRATGDHEDASLRTSTDAR